MLLALALIACGGDEPTSDPGPRLPQSPVEILVDDRGIPHIYAQSDEDLFFAYGYQMASDRLLQLSMFRRFAHGRLSEILGAAGPGSVGDNSLVDDRFARIFDWKKWGRMDADWMQANEPEHWKLTSAWVAGINRRIEEVRSGQVALPFGFGPDQLDFMPEPWSDDDVYIVQKMAGFGLDQTILFEVFVTFTKQLAPEALEAIELFRPARETFVLPEGDRPAGQMAMNASSGVGQACRGAAGTSTAMAEPQRAALRSLSRLSHLTPLGSNNWAVDGSHTDSGRPIIAGDPHLGYDFSGVTYGLHLNSKDAGGSFDVTGFSFVGAPGIFAGHNDRVAWTETSAFADVMDMWAVELVDGQVKIGDELVDTVERDETIAIRGADPEVVTVVDVPGYGVIMPSALVGSPLPIAGAGKEVLIGWTGFRARPARYFRELMRVQDLDEFEAAVDRMPEMTYNFMAADATGLSYRVGVEIPARNTPAPGREPWWTMDGNDPSAFWPAGSFLSPDQKPHSRAVERGWIASANNDPFGFTADGRIDDDPWYYGALFPPGWRAARIEGELERLISEGEIDVESMQALQMDVHSSLADDLVEALAEVYAEVGTDPALSDYADRPELDTLVQLLTVDWDRGRRRDSAGALAFHAFAHLLAAQIIEDDLSSILFGTVLEAAPMYMLKIAALAIDGAYPNGDAVMQEGRDVIILLALDRTATWLEDRFGSVDPSGYRYADVRVSSMEGAYGRGLDMFEVPTDGGEDTVNVAQSTFRDGGEIADQWVSHWGPIERQVMTFDEDGRPRSWSNYALGNVADPASPHYDDAMDDWVEGTYRPMLFERGAIESASEQRVEIPAVE
jgi:penicillin amidase